ncbi:hypothetical protein ACQF36_29870 [Streptomyces sp. Marseille-Q5077]|uniref:hypothetical protein n=1 Tax=Streptomyces sp. Marseille-Q5077 TaxID=3418995 RepID=UPI003D09037D
MDGDQDLLNTPQDARDMSYFLALLRELDGPAEAEFANTVWTISQWMNARRVPASNRCAVHNRIATVLIESGQFTEAFQALNNADPVTSLEEAYTFAQLGMLGARLEQWEEARRDAGRAARLAAEADDSVAWLDVRMRAAHVLFRAECAIGEPTWRRVEDLVRELEEVCGRQIDRWGSDHPRALEALVIMTEAQHIWAKERGDAATMERLSDVLSVAAQRSATALGARHPQAKEIRAALEQAMRAEQHQALQGQGGGLPGRWSEALDWARQVIEFLRALEGTGSPGEAAVRNMMGQLDALIAEAGQRHVRALMERNRLKWSIADMAAEEQTLTAQAAAAMRSIETGEELPGAARRALRRAYSLRTDLASQEANLATAEETVRRYQECESLLGAYRAGLQGSWMS